MHNRMASNILLINSPGSGRWELQQDACYIYIYIYKLDEESIQEEQNFNPRK